MPCSKSREFYGLQKHSDDVLLTDDHTLRHALSEKKEPVLDLEDRQTSVVSVKKNGNQLDDQAREYKHRGGHVRGREHSKNSFLQVRTEDSPVIRINPIVEEERRFRVRGQSR